MPEYQDIYDIHRNPTGRTILRGTRREEGEYILVIHLLIFDTDGRLLVQRRVPDKSTWPDMWDISLGGLAQAGDTSRTATEREALEELGLHLDLTDAEPVLSVRGHGTHDDYYAVTVPAGTALTLQPEEVAEARWVGREAWQAMLDSRQVIPYFFADRIFELARAAFPGARVFPERPERIRGAVFDMDGLLLDTERVADRAWDEAAAQVGFADVERAKAACLGVNEAATRDFFLRTYGEDFDYDGFRSLARQLSHAVTDVEVPVKEGAAAILRLLQDAGIRLAVASSTREVTVRDQLSRAGLLTFFDAVVTGDQVQRSKPDPEIFRKAADAIGLPPRECLAFEDSVNGIRSAFRAGLFPVHIPDLQPANAETQGLSWRRFDSLTQAAEDPELLELVQGR
ncbi:MAG: HAD-IA family hydrolase [Oscillospiraceae bacterium]|nr:HAD-IA family hydrolase [Oscillospiraceae bacterium]